MAVSPRACGLAVWLQEAQGNPKLGHRRSDGSHAGRGRAETCPRHGEEWPCHGGPRDGRQRRVYCPQRWRLWATGLLVVLLTAAGWLLMLRHPSQSSSELVQKRLTYNPSGNAVQSDAVSPGSKYLAYSDAAGIHLKLVSTPNSSQLHFSGLQVGQTVSFLRQP